jgi:hypothetical protein
MLLKSLAPVSVTTNAPEYTDVTTSCPVPIA